MKEKELEKPLITEEMMEKPSTKGEELTEPLSTEGEMEKTSLSNSPKGKASTIAGELLGASPAISCPANLSQNPRNQRMVSRNLLHQKQETGEEMEEDTEELPVTADKHRAASPAISAAKYRARAGSGSLRPLWPKQQYSIHGFLYR